MDISNESQDEDKQHPVVISNAADVTNVPADTEGKVLLAVKVPYIFDSHLNTRDSQFYEAVISSDKKAAIHFYRIKNQALLSKSGGYPIGDADWATKTDTTLQYIDNSSGLIVAFNKTGLTEFRGSNIATAETKTITMPSPERIPEMFVHGEILVAIGFGATAAAAMNVESVTFGENI